MHIYQIQVRVCFDGRNHHQTNWYLKRIFRFFSCYNKIVYKSRWKTSIINSFWKQHHDCLYIGLNDTISVWKEVYVVYLVKLDARVTNSDIYKVTKRCYCTRIFSIKLQWKCQWQRCKDNQTKQQSDEVKKVMKSDHFLVEWPF